MIAAAVLVVTPALSAAPPEDSEDWMLMAPFREWVETRHTQSGNWCCSLADGRPVDTRVVDGHWQILITPEKFPGSLPGWTRVPDNVVLHEMNPTGVPIAWVMHGVIFCFAPSSGG